MVKTHWMGGVVLIAYRLYFNAGQNITLDGSQNEINENNKVVLLISKMLTGQHLTTQFMEIMIAIKFTETLGMINYMASKIMMI